MKTTMKTTIKATTAFTLAVSTLLLALGAPARATEHEHSHDHGTQGAAADAGAAVDEFVNAEIRAIDRDNAKLMLKHEAIRKFNMNGMTMGFRVADPKLIEALAVGDKVRFMPDRVNGQYVITKIEKLQ